MSQTLLLIEDDKTTQLLYKHVLKNVAFVENIVVANNGLEALSYYEKLETGEEPIAHLPKIVLLDLNMPVMDGWQFFEEFEKRFPHFAANTKIFILSSSVNPADETRADKEKNIVAFLAKPLLKEHVAFIQNMLEKK